MYERKGVLSSSKDLISNSADFNTYCDLLQIVATMLAEKS